MKGCPLQKKFKITKKNVIWSYASTIFSMASNFLLLPLIFYFLNKNEIGYWYLILSVNSLTALFDFGFDPAFARNIAYVWSGISSLKNQGIDKNVLHRENMVNYHLLSATIHTARVIYLMLAIIALLLIGTCGTVYMILIVFHTLTSSVYKWTWVVFCISMFTNIYFGYFSALLRGSGKIEEVNKALVFSRLAQILFTGVGFLLSASIIVPVFGLLIYGILFRFFCNGYFWQDDLIRKHQKILREHIDMKEIQSIFIVIWPNTWRDGFVSISNYLTTQGMSLIAGTFLSLSATGTYSIGIQFASALSSAAASINGAVHPILQSLFVERDFVGLRKQTAIAITAYIWLFWFGSFLTVNFIFPILKMVKTESVPDNGVFSLMLVYFFLYQLHSIHASFIANANIIPYTRAFIISALINLALLVVVLKIAGGSVYVLLLIPIIVQGAYNNWRWPMYYYSMINANFKSLIVLGNQIFVEHIKKIIH